ncbi:MAG TPA: S41 family peptidase [Chloroflexota bacterium]|nr:S41 family peptidase [Chloroflexota bacterium]
MARLRALLVALLLAYSIAAGGLVYAQPATTATAVQAAAAEDNSTQVQVVESAFNLLMDRYVHPLNSAEVLKAGWNQLDRDATDRAAAPGPAPAFDGNRDGDLDRMRTALTAYLSKDNGSPDGFIAAHAIVRGMVRVVDEGHTYFLDPQQYSDYESWSRGDNKYVGIGISVSARGAEPRIAEVYEDTPAQRAGLQAGDVLVMVNGQAVEGLQLDEMTGLVRGPAGSRIDLVVRRGDPPQTLQFSLQRAEIRLQFVKQRLLADDIGYVLLRGFPEPSVIEAIENDVAGFQEQGIRGLVLDLRGNSGGRIDVGTRLLSHFLPAGSSVYEETDRSGQNRTHFSRAGSQYGLPLVVLVDGGTASMGEIFASAVQEHGAATVIGTTTAGSVAAAQVFGLPDGAGLQVTVYEIRSSDGKPLNRVGVVPDEVVESDPAGVAGGAADPVLSRAIEILKDDV